MNEPHDTFGHILKTSNKATGYYSILNITKTGNLGFWRLLASFLPLLFPLIFFDSKSNRMSRVFAHTTDSDSSLVFIFNGFWILLIYLAVKKADETTDESNSTFGPHRILLASSSWILLGMKNVEIYVNFLPKSCHARLSCLKRIAKEREREKRFESSRVRANGWVETRFRHSHFIQAENMREILPSSKSTRSNSYRNGIFIWFEAHFYESRVERATRPAHTENHSSKNLKRPSSRKT